MALIKRSTPRRENAGEKKAGGDPGGMETSFMEG